MNKISFTLNGEKVSLEVNPMARVLDVLRYDLKKTGTKEGCGEGECGACSILVNGELVNTCLLPAIQIDGAKLVTIEGLASKKDKLSALQEAFIKYNGAQCGMCTPGMIMASKKLLDENPNPSESEIREGLGGNLCRCTGYMKIFDAVKAVRK